MFDRPPRRPGAVVVVVAVVPVPLDGLPEVGGVPEGSTLPRPTDLVRLSTPLVTPLSDV